MQPADVRVAATCPDTRDDYQGRAVLVHGDGLGHLVVDVVGCPCGQLHGHVVADRSALQVLDAGTPLVVPDELD